jgi:hypothetical protein
MFSSFSLGNFLYYNIMTFMALIIGKAFDALAYFLLLNVFAHDLHTVLHVVN